MTTRPIPFLNAVLLLSTLAVAQDPAPRHDLRLWYRQPANPQAWEEALPVGSGRLGAMVFGGTAQERIQFNEDTLWTGRPRDYVREGAREHLDEIRRLIFEGKLDEAAQLFRAKMISDPVRQKAYQPFGDVHLDFAGHEQVEDYYRELDIDSAIATTRYRVGAITFTREVFASYPDNAIVIRLTADQPGKVTFTARLDSPHKESKTIAPSKNTLVLDGQVLDPIDNTLGLRYEARLVAQPQGGQLRTLEDDSLRVEHADAVTLLVVARTSFVNFRDISGNPSARCDDDLKPLQNAGYDELRARHVADHRALFRRVSLDLGRTPRADLPTDERLKLISRGASAVNSPDPKSPISGNKLPKEGLDDDPQLVSLYFQFGRYLLIASSRPGTQPANLQGVWNQLLNPPWESKYTTNINFQMNYWPAEVCNLAELHQPMFDLVREVAVSGAITAAKQYGAGGWVLHHNTDLWRGTAPINNIDGMWPTGGAWLAWHTWEHYLYARDLAFLEKTAYPMLKGASEFFLDFLVEHPKHPQWLVTVPTHSPEQGPLTAGTAMDMQLIRACFDATIEAATLLGVDNEFVDRVGRTRARLVPDQVGRHGQLQEWLEDLDQPNNNHRHLSPLWGLFPGNQFTPENDPKTFEAAKLLLKWRGDGSTGWSFGWRIPLWARVHDGDFAFRQLYLQLARRTFPNLFDKCGPFQVDGNFGATAGIAEMLLQNHQRLDSETHVVHLLPALPEAWPSGAVTGLRARGGFELDMQWSDRKLTRVELRSKLGSPLRLRYGSQAIDLKTDAGATYRFDGTLRKLP